MQKNHELELAFEFVQYTNRNIFLTGKAGTGKTTFLKSLKTRSHKRMVVVAPTGVAAINAGGVTIHSFFQLPFGPIITEKVAGYKINNPNVQQKFNSRKINIIKSLDLLVIDEISMVRADMLDAIDEILRKYKNRFQPFGGVQLLMIGDLQQLAPVVKDDEWSLLKKYYQSMYFFNSKSLIEADMITVELKYVYRQADEKFLKILNQIRNDKLSKESYDILHERYISDFKPNESEGYITLTTHNASANKTNEEHLLLIKGKTFKFSAKIKGQFSEYSFPTDEILELKIGSQVMYVKNDSSLEKRYFNGKIGTITDILDNEIIVVKCPEDEEPIYTSTEIWENIKYSIDDKTKDIKEEFVGSFEQYPLRLAWAITIHKSQGLTFEKAIIDAASAFAHGQTYVALSRCKTLEGLVLSSKISNNAIICNREVSAFNNKIEENQPTDDDLLKSKYKYQLSLINEIFNYKQLTYRLEHFEKIIEDNHKIVHGTLGEIIMNIQRTAMPEIIKVALNFGAHLNHYLLENPDIESNSLVQERLKKASEYFYEQHQEKIFKPLNNSSFATDNKVAKKSINDQLASIYAILTIKQRCLEACKNGFTTEKILDVRAKAALEKSEETTKLKVRTKEVETKHPELYSLLKYWRQEQVNILQQSHYQIATQKMLQGIANELPCTLNQLKKINGVGKVKIQQFGEELVSMVLEYIEEKGLERTPLEADIIKPKKISNKDMSFKLFNEGKTIDEIAKTCGFVKSTIENHISYFINIGKLPMEALVDDKKAKIIMETLKKNPESSFTEIKEMLPIDISFGQIRAVKSFLEQQKTDNQND